MTAINLPPRPVPPRLKPATGPAFKKFEFAVQDYETESIERRPAYPPRSVGCSLLLPGEKQTTYYCWGHPTELLPTKNVVWEPRERFAERVRDLRRSGVRVVYQNGKFDTDVEDTEFPGLPARSWDKVDDTLYLIFLHDPHAVSFSLKPSAQRILGLKPEEQDRLHDWLVTHKYVTRKEKDWGAYISKAPASVVGPYANGDVLRTKKLFEHLLPEIHRRGMMPSYDRERRLMPILLATERAGVRCALGAPPTTAQLNRGDLKPRGTLEWDYVVYGKALADADAYIRRALKAPTLNVDADQDLGNALAAQGAVTEWTWTAGSKDGKRAPQRSVSKKNLLIGHFKDRRLALVYAYRQRLQTCLSTFFESWLSMARAGGGRIYCTWNQVRQSHDSGSAMGARTSRLSSSPNFQNIPKDFEDKNDGFVFEPWMAAWLPPLPLMRRYLLPEEGEVWIHRDINQQELRFTAHFEDGELAAHYNAEPRFDIHSEMQRLMAEMGLELNRPQTKIVNFSDLYGKGVTGLAEDLGVDRKTAQEIKAAKARLMPGVAALTDSVKARGMRGEPVRTWGGSEIYCEPPGYSEKHQRVMDFSYKLLNHLIQRSSAEFTKEVVIAYDAHPKRQARFLLTVHDELNSSSVRGRVKEEMRIKREVIENIPGVGVPMISDGKTGPNWAELKKYED